MRSDTGPKSGFGRDVEIRVGLCCDERQVRSTYVIKIVHSSGL